jgi:hypothetical protein
MSRSHRIQTSQDLLHSIAALAQLLEVPAPSLDELRDVATRTGKAREAARLDALDR